MPHDMRSLEPICAKNAKTFPNGSKKNLHSGQEDAPYYTDPPTMPEGVRGVNSFARRRLGLPASGGLADLAGLRRRPAGLVGQNGMS